MMQFKYKYMQSCIVNLHGRNIKSRELMLIAKARTKRAYFRCKFSGIDTKLGEAQNRVLENPRERTVSKFGILIGTLSLCFGKFGRKFAAVKTCRGRRKIDGKGKVSDGIEKR